MGRTVLIVDDHAPFRQAARELLAAAGYEVVGDAADGRSSAYRRRVAESPALGFIPKGELSAASLAGLLE